MRSVTIAMAIAMATVTESGGVLIAFVPADRLTDAAVQESTMLRIALVMALIVLGGCVAKYAEVRIESALLGYGVAPRQASCMADDLSRKLTIDQLRILSRLATESKQGFRNRPLRDLVTLAAKVGDQDMVVKVARATIGCAVRG